jgi:Spy/CpxP family protein refolding chaperone
MSVVLNIIKFARLIVGIICLMLMLHVPVNADSQQASGRGGRIAKALNLTDAQKSELKPLLRNARGQILSIRNDTTLTPDERKQKMKAIREEVRTGVQQILTPEQMQQLRTLRQQARAARQSQQAAPPIQ